MTIYRFALFPKSCDKCGRIFIWERYDIFFKQVGIEYYSLKCVKCKECMDSGAR